MFKTNRFAMVLGALLLGSFVFWTYHLLQIRFLKGDVYPAYSSLRADPVGSKALFESLDGLPGIEAVRNFERQRLLKDANSSILILGMPPLIDEDYQAEVWKETRTLIHGGNHLTIAFKPHMQVMNAVDDLLGRYEDEDVEASEEEVSYLEFSLRAHSPSQDRSGMPQPLTAKRVADLALPDSLPWRTIVYFHHLDPGWDVIYQVEDRPVVIAKTGEEGSVILTTDSYFFSNEALSESRQPQLLSWLIGAKDRVVFEETHFGLRAQTNLMGIIRRFGLHGLLLGLLMLGFMFIWQQSSSLLPPIESEKHGTAIGKHAASGLVSLLSRGVPESNLIETCIEEWRKNLKVLLPLMRSREPAVQAMLKEAKANSSQSESIVTQYNQIQRLTARRSPPN